TLELLPLAEPRPASEQIHSLREFWTSRLRPLEGAGLLNARERRAREAVAAMLEALETVHLAHDDPEWTIREVAVAVRRSIEEQTFVPAPPVQGGVQLLDDQAARYGSFDDVAIVGLIDPDWPERPRRNIFYPPSLLKSLGWPSEQDRRAAADARFVDLLARASRQTQLFPFTLDEDALGPRWLQPAGVARPGLSAVERTPDADLRVFVDEALSREPVMLDRLSGEARGWAELRLGRS